jgi:PPP family 3-phenylpropionic acid transporter
MAARFERDGAIPGREPIEGGPDDPGIAMLRALVPDGAARRPAMRRLLTLRFYYAACFVALGVYLPFFPRWLEARGVHGAAMGAVAASVPAMGLVGPPLFGILSDRLGLRGTLLRVACVGAFACMGGVGAAFALGHPLGFAGIFAAVLAFSFFRSPMISLADVITLELAGAGAGYARTRLWGSVGFLVAAVAAGRYLDPAQAAALPLAISAALFIALITAWSLPAKSLGPALPALGAVGDLLARADLRLFFGASFLGQIAHANYDLCFTLHLRDLGASDALIGVSWALGVLSEVAVMAGASWIFRRSTPPWLLTLAFAGAAARWVLIATVTSIPALLALQPLHGLSFALMWLASLAYVKESAPRAALATAQGLFSAAVAAGSVLAMPLWGALYSRHGGSVTFGFAAIASAAAAGVALVWARRTTAQNGTPSVAGAITDRTP